MRRPAALLAATALAAGLVLAGRALLGAEVPKGTEPVAIAPKAEAPASLDLAPAAPLDVAPAPQAAVHVVPFSEIGRGKTEDGRPVAPASFLADAEGVTVLDQENQRIVLPNGEKIALPSRHADDLARAGDGFAVLDRTHAKEVVLLGPDGRVRGHLPLAGSGVDDARDVSRLVVHGADVLVERNGGGPLLRIGFVDGAPAEPRTEVQGLPTRDGTGLVSAGVTREDEGRAWVTMADRQAAHRWTRELRFPGEVSAVGFVDTDANGTVWAVVLAGSSPSDYANWAVCLDGATGHVRGSFSIPVESSQFESFRDFAVRDGAGLVVAKRGESGVSYATYACP
jgi:hypothetical protein